MIGEGRVEAVQAVRVKEVVGRKSGSWGNTQDIPFRSLWGNTSFSLVAVESCGRSGGIFCIWDPSWFNPMQELKNKNFIFLSGKWVGIEVRLNIVNVYASKISSERKALWSELLNLKADYPGWWVFLGDFNETRVKEDRLPASGCESDMAAFNTFIASTGLFEFNMGGRRFTWMSDDGNHLSKIDRFLVCKDFLGKWPSGTVTALPRNLSDHCPLVFSARDLRYGPVPFKFFNSWLSCEGLSNVVKDSWLDDRNCISKELNLMRKL
ncbi:uncharacterized protein LOC143575636 [Bidens hawaiensis]|uniref:uncharacterized protein LOC143575636 n=1 Tax=Bidens hawaiensis TaxID=980011 RepID=UPI00404AD320